jgi:hypothetical protein
VTDDVVALDDARRRLGLSHYDLWVRYLGVGGTHDASGVRSYLNGHDTFTDADHDHLAVALNEAFIDAGNGRPLPYRIA